MRCRDELLPEMRRIFTTLGSTVLYVTHDHDEAFAVANEVFVMRSGELVGHGTPEELWRRPPDLETARFFGFEPEIAAVVSSGVADLEFGSLAVDVADGSYVAAFAPGAAVLDPAGNVSATVMTSPIHDAGPRPDGGGGGTPSRAAVAGSPQPRRDGCTLTIG